MVVLAGLALVIGLLVAILAARATADPVVSVRDALAEVERGNLDVEVPVYDGSEVGLLQAGFNRMVAGQRERERIRETFGTYVDADVAEHILSEEGGAEGQEVEVTLMFLDVRDFTGFAERADPQEVVSALNGLFERAVPIVRKHGGHIDKFIGDGFLAVFGRPGRPQTTPTGPSPRRSRSRAPSRTCPTAPDRDRAQLGLGGGGEHRRRRAAGVQRHRRRRQRRRQGRVGDPPDRRRHPAQRANPRAPAGDHELIERPGIELKGKSGQVTLYAPRLRHQSGS